MDQILSQEEIDALLSAMSSKQGIASLKEEDRSQSVKPYDFRRPEKFSKDQLRALQLLLETFARQVSASWSAHVRTTVRVALASLEQMTFNEFVHSVPSPTVLAIFHAPPLQGRAVLEINPGVAFAMMDRLLGGQGKPPPAPRELTEIELIIMEGIIVKALDDLKGPWQGVIDIAPKLESIEMNAQFSQIVAENEAVLHIAFEASMSDKLGMMSLCFPDLFMEGLVPKLTTQQWMSGGLKVSATETQLLRTYLAEAEVPVRVEAGRARLRVRDLMELQVGDVVRLDQRTDEGVRVVIDNDVKFVGWPGLNRRQLSVQVMRAVDQPAVTEAAAQGEHRSGAN